ncbi:hypothetical protein BD410DRAFT_524939 [Rickenella mellea]|uniref:J domain-containing protein n=1 Tax=Rickenella mellea TaxID=50990 RepID=A0A4Y7QFT1_9AGAM|nr:hypothetical protein BD410DRAFT_524939 [Rickenella mellea]
MHKSFNKFSTPGPSKMKDLASRSGPRRLIYLPVPLIQLIHVGLASSFSTTSSQREHDDKCPSPFTFPRKPRPTPYGIFYLSPGSPQIAIKSRYCELVRVHHPDSLNARTLPPRISHARFQAIIAAYGLFTSAEYTAVHRYGTQAMATECDMILSGPILDSGVVPRQSRMESAIELSWRLDLLLSPLGLRHSCTHLHRTLSKSDTA